MNVSDETLRSDLADAVRAHLKERGLSLRQAAKVADLPLQTLHSFLNNSGGLASSKTRAALVRLGMSQDIVDTLAARQAGLSVPIQLDEYETMLVQLRRSLSHSDLKQFEDQLAAWFQRARDKHAYGA
jgi:predicted ATPase